VRKAVIFIGFMSGSCASGSMSPGAISSVSSSVGSMSADREPSCHWHCAAAELLAMHSSLKEQPACLSLCALCCDACARCSKSIAPIRTQVASAHAETRAESSVADW